MSDDASPGAARADSGAAPDAAPTPAGPPIPQAVISERIVRERPDAGRAFMRFAIVGSIGIVVNLAVLEVLHGVLGLGFLRSSIIATETAILSNYAGNELWTFHLRRLNLGRALKFNAASLLALVITAATAEVLKEHVHYLAAQLAGIGLGSGANFAVSFLWTWRR